MEPGRLLGQKHDSRRDEEEEDDDIDAEGEEDSDIDLIQPARAPARSMEDDSEADAEGEEIDDDELDNITRATSAAISGVDEQQELDDEDEDGEAVSDDEADAKSDESEVESGSSESESDAEEWKAASSVSDEEAEAEIGTPTRCIFCGEDEENDPSPDYEEFLSCTYCGDNSHPQCARNNNSFHTDEDPKKWRCNTCYENGMEADDNDDDEDEEDEQDEEIKPPELISNSRRRPSAPKMARDLLPTGSRGDVIPNTHSVFNTLILEDDPMDGTRSLRKRKASEMSESAVRSIRKRGRASEAPSGGLKSSSPEAVRVAVPGSTAGAEGAEEEDEDEDEEEDEQDEEDEDDEDAPPTRGRRTRRMDKPLAHVIKSEWISLIVAFNLDPTKLNDITRKRPNPKRWQKRQGSQKKIVAPPLQEPEPSHYPALQSNFAALWTFHEREQDESKIKPYGGILSESEANTEKTFPQFVDRKRFEDARLKAEDDWKQKAAAAAALQENIRSTTKQSGPPSKIKCINFGGYEIDTWHAAPYPEEYSRNRVLYICEFCLKYMNSDYVAWRHKLKCPAKHPPGDEVYRDGKYSFFEVDGRKNPVYCQNLCLLAKLFLGSKTLYYDVEPFLFYVMTENDEFGCHFVGYFSKEKRPSSLNNVSCILVLPIHQRKGFGHMLIEFSYLLTRVEQKTGSPEKPLSDMGLVSYRGYWRLIMCYHLRDHTGPISITQISERTGMTADDIVSALEGLRALVRDPVTKVYALRLDHKYYQEYISNYEKKNYPKINPDALVWTPYVMGRSSLSSYESGPTLHTVAQRDEEEPDDEPEEGVQQTLQAQKENSKSNGSGDAVAIVGKGKGSSKGGRNSQPSHRTKDPSIALSTSDEVGNKQSILTPRPTYSPNRSFPSTPPRVNGFHTPGKGASATIPATRFEVFPPMPGRQASSSSSTRPRRNRPFGSRRRTSTPNKRNGSSHSALINGESPAALKRNRSKLGEVVINGDADDNEGDDAEAANDDTALDLDAEADD